MTEHLVFVFIDLACLAAIAWTAWMAFWAFIYLTTPRRHMVASGRPSRRPPFWEGVHREGKS